MGYFFFKTGPTYVYEGLDLPHYKIDGPRLVFLTKHYRRAFFAHRPAVLSLYAPHHTVFLPLVKLTPCYSTSL